MSKDPNENLPVIKHLLQSRGLDETLKLAGDFHSYQWKVMLILGFQWILTSFVVMIQPFLNQMPQFECPGANGEMVSCTEAQATTTGCNINWAETPNSLIVSLGLYCDNANLRTLAQSLFFAGGSIGTLLLSRIGDLKGRKPALVISYAIGSLSILALALYHTNAIVYMILLSLCWAGFDPFFAFSLIILNEKGGERIRQIGNPFLLLNWGFGEIIFVILAYNIQNYQIELLYVVALPGFLAMGLFWWIKESPRYLLTNDKMDEATKVIDHIAYSNNKEEAVSPQLHPNIDALVQFVNYTGKPRQVQQVDTEYSVIFKNKKLLRTQILFSLIIAYLYLAYNGILFGLNYLQGSLYTNSLVTSIAETSAYAVSILLIPRFNRKTLFKSLFFVGAVFGVLFQFIPMIQPLCSQYSWCTDDLLTAFFCLFMKFCNAFAFGLIYIYGSEVFPTVARGKCMGLGISFGRAVSTVAPFLNVFAVSLNFNPMFFYGIGALICLPLLTMLPETFGKDLPDFIEPDEEKAERETDVSQISDYTKLA